MTGGWDRTSAFSARAIGAGVMSFVLLALGCAGTTPPPETNGVDLRPRVEGPLHRWLPEGGDPVVLFNPQVLVDQGPMRDVVHALVGSDFVGRIQQRTAIDLLSIQETALSFYDDETLLLARGPYAAEEVVTVVGMHMRVLLQEDSEPTRISGTYDGRTLVHAAAIGPREIALSRGEGSTLSRLLQLIHGRENRAPDRLNVADIRLALNGLTHTHLRILVGSPPRLPLDSPLGLLLANQRALAIAIGDEGPSHLGIELAFVGEFPEGAEANFRHWIGAMATDDLGRVMGLDTSLASLDIVASPDRIIVSFALPSEQVVRGVRILFDAEIADFLHWSEVEETPEPLSSTQIEPRHR